jgi:hypothetical protein
MQKAAEDLRNEAKAKAEEKERYINERVGVLNLEGKAEGTSDVSGITFIRYAQSKDWKT